MAVTAGLVKELRERTGAGMMDCKKALVEANADIELAIENMRKSGAAKAAKKAGRIAAEGRILIESNNDKCAIVEVNCETDFVAKDENFLAFANKVTKTALSEKLDIESLKSKFETERAELVTKIGENIEIRRVNYLDGKKVGEYRHGEKIGVVVAGDAPEETLKHVAMHIAASKPDYVNPTDVPSEVVEKEKQIQIEIAMQSGKPAQIAEKMVEGRMKKFTGEVSLTGQAFVMEPSKTVGDMLKEKNASVTNFIRLEVGEGIEKEESMSFAEEVAAAQKGS